MKFPFSLFGKKPKAEDRSEEAPDQEPAPFPVELAVAQVQAATGMRFGQPASQQSELLEAAAVLSVLDYPQTGAAPQIVQTKPAPQPVLSTSPAQARVSAPGVPPEANAAQPQQIAVAPQGAVVGADEKAPIASPAVAVAADVGVGRDEVVAAYRLFLCRDPESDTVIEPRLGMSREKLLSTFIVSPEFLQRSDNVKLLLEVARSLEARQPASVVAPGIPVLTQADVDAAKRIFWPDPHDQAIQPLAGESADRTLSQLMRSEHFQKNEFNATLVNAVAKQIVERLNKK